MVPETGTTYLLAHGRPARGTAAGIRQDHREQDAMSQATHLPFSNGMAARRVRLAEDAWNSRDPDLVVPAYSADCRWRSRSVLVEGRAAIHAFLTEAWRHEHDGRLVNEVWASLGARIALRFACEWHDGFGNWYRSFGNENWEFDGAGLIRQRIASINDLPIDESARLFRWPPGRRPDDHPGLSDLGL
jgi:hypothetical protein